MKTLLVEFSFFLSEMTLHVFKRPVMPVGSAPLLQALKLKNHFKRLSLISME
jgi:hypothetical protein